MFRIGRFRIPLDGSKYGKLETAVEAEKHGRAMDMCSINPLHLGLKYRYVYACGAKRPCNFPNALSKVPYIYIDYIVKQFVPDILEIYTVLSILFVTYVCVVDQDL